MLSQNKLSKLTKKEILKLASLRCKHNHTLLEHPSCIPESGIDIPELVGYLDIETVGLNANWDYIISVYIADNNGNIWGRTLTREEVLDFKILDKYLMKETCTELKKYDKIVVYWGKDRRHDIPFLRTRASLHGYEFPPHGSIVLVDLYDVVRSKLRLHRYRLQNVCKLYDIPAKEHPLDEIIWQRAKLGDKKALKYIDLHCKEDVISLRELDKKIRHFYGKKRSSI